MNGPAGRKRKTQHTKKDAMKFVAKILTIAAALSSLSMGANQVTVDSSIKPYAPTSGVSGNLNAVGSDTLNNLMTLWAEGFSKKYPSVKVGVEGSTYQWMQTHSTSFHQLRFEGRPHEPPDEAGGNRRL